MINYIADFLLSLAAGSIKPVEVRLNINDNKNKNTVK